MVASRRVGAALQRHPLTWSIVLTIIWLVAVHGLAEVLTPGRRGTEGDLRAAAVNAGALVVPLAVIAVAGWRLRAGLGAGRRWLLLVLIAILYASFLAFASSPYRRARCSPRRCCSSRSASTRRSCSAA